jgi:ubiquinone/menaquinone biosynthesis C-methylase UbiE
MSFDPDAVRAFEHAGWQQAAARYQSTFAAATGEFAEALLDAAEVGAGVSVLDLCCGSGLVAGAAASRGAVVSGLDFSPAMLAVARAAHPALHFAEGDAESLPFSDASFEAMVSNFGVHHLARPERAMAEAMRVLRPGGRLAVTTWAVPVENAAWGLLFDAIRLHGDIAAAKTPPSGGGLGSEAAVLHLLREVGFAAPAAETLRAEWKLAQPGDLLAALQHGTVRTAALIEAQRPAALLAIEAEIARRAAAYRRAGWYCLPIAAILGRGVKS